MIFENAGADIPSDADVCIVGAGPVGLALAFKCASQGLSVIIFESGNSKHVNHNETALGAVEIITPHHVAPELSRAQGIGGTSRLWGGRCVALDDIDFESRDHVRFSGWPIPHAEIAAHYDESLTFLGCDASTGVLAKEYPKPGSEIAADMLERWSAVPDLRWLHGERLRASRNIKIYTGCTVTGIRLDSGAGARPDSPSNPAATALLTSAPRRLCWPPVDWRMHGCFWRRNETGRRNSVGRRGRSGDTTAGI